MGGDLNFFGKGAMVPEFDAAVFAMQPGQISDLVKTQYGFHIIKLVDKRAAGVRPLAEVRPEIIERLKWERAQARSTEISTSVASELKTPADFDRVAKANGLVTKESGFFLRDEPIADLGPSPQVASEAFTLKDGDSERAAAHGAGLRVRHRDGQAAVDAAGARRREGARPQRHHPEEGGRRGQGGGGRPGADAEVGGELRGGGEDGRTRDEDDRADLARRRHPRRGREPGGRQGRVLARRPAPSATRSSPTPARSSSRSSSAPT